MNQRETKLICTSTIALSLVALCAVAYDSPRLDGPATPDPPPSQNYPLFAQADRADSLSHANPIYRGAPIKPNALDAPFRDAMSKPRVRERARRDGASAE